MNEIFNESEEKIETLYGSFGYFLLALSKIMAVSGGLIMVALVIMSIVSILGRKLVSFPVPGDVEVLQMSAAVASASFFAYCHIKNGDVKVDFFTAHASRCIRHGLDGCGSFLVGLFGAIVAWRVTAGAKATLDAGETSAILAWPVGIAQAAMIPGFVLLALTGFYLALRHIQFACRSLDMRKK